MWFECKCKCYQTSHASRILTIVIVYYGLNVDVSSARLARSILTITIVYYGLNVDVCAPRLESSILMRVLVYLV